MSTPPAFALYPAERYALTQPRGVVTLDTIVTTGLAIVQNPGWRPGFTEVWDVRFATSVDFTPSDVPKVLELERETAEALAGSATIIIAQKPLIHFAATFYSRLVKRTGRRVLVAETAVEAASLLGIDRLPDLTEGSPLSQTA
jgi:hypothetical protein